MNTLSNVIATSELVGRWCVESLDGKRLNAFFIESAYLELGADGRCRFEVRMSEVYGGAGFPWGSGGWYIIGSVLEYRPDEGGEILSGVELDAEGAKLTLSPDPFIAVEGGTVGRCVYRRHA